MKANINWKNAFWLIIVINVVLVLLMLSSCTTAIGNDKTGDYCVMTFLQGTARGVVDPNSGRAVYLRTGDSELSGVQITKDREGYQVYFDQSKSSTEWDLFLKGIEIGKELAPVIP